jgi:hypothetical protein
MTFQFARPLALLLAVAFLLHCPLPAVAQAGKAPSGGFLWEATRGTERVLLLGSIHVGRPEFAASIGHGLPQAARAEVFAFEANIFDALASAEAAQRWAMYPEGGPGLDAYVDAATLARIEKLVARYGGAMPVCCRLKPWMLANTLVILEAMHNGMNPAYGSEAQLYQTALSSGRPIVEIEGVDEQLRLFDDAAVELQVEYLRHALQTIESGASRAELAHLVGAWERADAAEMERLVAKMASSERPAERFVADRIVRGRHPKMLAAIDRFAGSGRLHLVVIGALHYFGPDGLLQGLRSRGYTLQRLR